MVHSANYSSKNKFVDAYGNKVSKDSPRRSYFDVNGNKVIIDYQGRSYHLVAKHERRFSKWERITRLLMGLWLIVRSFGRDLSSKRVKHLFHKDHESKRFGVPHNHSFDKIASGKQVHSKHTHSLDQLL